MHAYFRRVEELGRRLCTQDRQAFHTPAECLPSGVIAGPGDACPASIDTAKDFAKVLPPSPDLILMLPRPSRQGTPIPTLHGRNRGSERASGFYEVRLAARGKGGA